MKIGLGDWDLCDSATILGLSPVHAPRHSAGESLVLPTYLLKHRLEEHEQPRVPLHQTLKFNQHRMQRFGIPIHMSDRIAQILVMMSFVLRHPLPGLS